MLGPGQRGLRLGHHRLEGRGLARGKIGGYEFNRMVVLFSMMDGAREIPCAVSASAMDEIEHVSRITPDQREQQFLRLRDRIEQCASRKFLAGEFEGTWLEFSPESVMGFSDATREQMTNMSLRARRPLNWNFLLPDSSKPAMRSEE